MAATQFQLYNRAKRWIANGRLVLGTGASATAMKLRLHNSTSNASTFTLSTIASLTGACTGGGYPAGGKALSGQIWTTRDSAKKFRFDASAVVFSAVGSTLLKAKFGVIGGSRSANDKLLCWSKLQSPAADVTAGNTLTVGLTGGILALT